MRPLQSSKEDKETDGHKEEQRETGVMRWVFSSETEALIKRSRITEKAKKAGCNKTNTPHRDKKTLSSWHAICILLPKAWRSRKNTHFDTYISERSFFKAGSKYWHIIPMPLHQKKMASGKVRLYMQQCMRVKTQVCMWKYVREKKYWYFWLAILISKLSVCSNSCKFE